MPAGLVNIKDIIHLYMDEAQLTTASYRRLYGIAYRGAIDLTLDVTGVAKSCELCVLGNKTAELPDDYIQWRKIGVLNGDGEVATLSQNESLTTINSSDSNRLSDNVGVTGVGDLYRRELFYTNFYGYGYEGVDVFGISGNQLASLGGFKVDKECGLIVFDPTFCYQSVIIEYLATPSEETGVMIPIQAQEALIAWIAWKDINQLAASRKVSIYDKTERKRAYYREKDLARNRIKPFYIEEAYDVSQQAMRLVVKS